MSGKPRPLPRPDPLTQPFWTGLRERRLDLQRCTDCGRHVFYPRGLCPGCWSRNLEWETVSGLGRLYAFTIVQQAMVGGFEDEVPYIVGLVELDEGPRMMARIVGVAPDPRVVGVGMALRIDFEDATDEITLPVFRPAD